MDRSPLQRIKEIISSGNNAKIVSVFALLLIIAAIPLTVYLGQTEQDFRQQASNEEKECKKTCNETERSCKDNCKDLSGDEKRNCERACKDQGDICQQACKAGATATPTPTAGSSNETPTPTTDSAPPQGTPTPTPSATCQSPEGRPDGCVCKGNNQCASRRCKRENKSDDEKKCVARDGDNTTPTPTPTGTVTGDAAIIVQHTLTLQGAIPEGSLSAGFAPRTATRTAQITLLRPSGETVRTLESVVTFDTVSKQFKADIALGIQSPGAYNVRIKVDRYLSRLLPNQTLRAGNNTMPTLYMYVGDVNNDNTIDVIDYGLVVGQACFGKSAPFSGECGRADLDDDADVDIIDANYLFRNLSVRQGE